jgi:hypothetical protein
MSTTKLTEEELQQVRDLRDKYANITARLGQLKAEQILVNNQLGVLAELEIKFTDEYLNLHTEEETFAAQITEKYGVGNIDVESGEFTSNI